MTFSCIFSYICVCVCIYTYTHTRTNAQTHIHAHTHTLKHRVNFRHLPKYSRILCVDVCLYICVYMHIYIHTHMQTHAHTLTHTHAHTHTHMKTHEHTHTHTQDEFLAVTAVLTAFIRVSSYIYIYVFVYIYMYMHTHAQRYTLTHVQKHKQRTNFWQSPQYSLPIAAYFLKYICMCICIRVYVYTHTHTNTHTHIHTKTQTQGEFSAVTAVLTAFIRKFSSLLFSYLLYPKPFNTGHGIFYKKKTQNLNTCHRRYILHVYIHICIPLSTYFRVYPTPQVFEHASLHAPKKNSLISSVR